MPKIIVIDMRFKYLLLAAHFAFIIATLVGCGDPCSAELVKASQSPGGLIEAGFFKKNCGATTGFVYELKVGSSSDSPSSRKLVLRFDDDHQINWPSDDRKVIGLIWLSNNMLEVTFAKPVRVFKKNASSGSVAIRYRLRPGSTEL